MNYDLKQEWHSNVLRNLRQQYPQYAGIADMELLNEYYTMQSCGYNCTFEEWMEGYFNE